VVGDRVAQFGILVVVEQEVPVGPAALPGARVGVQGAAHEQAVWPDGVDAEEVAVGQRTAGFTGLGGVVVRADQVGIVPLAGLPAVNPGVVRAGAGVARLALEVFEAGVHGLPDHLVGNPSWRACAQRPPQVAAVTAHGQP